MHAAKPILQTCLICTFFPPLVVLWQARVVFLEFLGHVRKNDLYNVERMLRRGLVESVDTREEVLGDSSLHVACGKGSAPMARLLLQGGKWLCFLSPAWMRVSFSQRSFSYSFF